VVRDPQNRLSSGLAFVEFPSVDHAKHVLQCSVGLKLDNLPLKIAFARETAMYQLIQKVRSFWVFLTFNLSCCSWFQES
jgi:RNA recognition motif-containing protein